MKVLLHADVPKLGYFGDIVEVKVGYARNYLIPQGIAVMPTKANIKAIEEERARKVEVRRLQREALVKAADRVAGAEVTIEANANEQGHLYGSITESMIAEALQRAGYEVKSSQVKMAEHFTMLGSFTVPLRFAEDLTTEVKVWVVREGQAVDSEQAPAESTETAE